MPDFDSDRRVGVAAAFRRAGRDEKFRCDFCWHTKKDEAKKSIAHLIWK